MKKIALVLALAIAPMAMGANLVELALDGSDMTGIGGYWAPVTGDFDGDTNADGYITSYEISGWWCIGIDLIALGIGPIDVSGLSASDTISWDARFFQAENNSNRWADAPIGFQMKTVNSSDPNFDYRAKWEWPFGPQGDAETFPDWTSVSTTWGDMAADPWFWSEPEGWDPTNVVELVFYGTNWYNGTPNEDFVQIKNLVITPEPSALVLLALGALAIRRR